MEIKHPGKQKTGLYDKLLAQRKTNPGLSIKHRLDFVTDLKRVRFINDSKATDINASWYSLETIESDIVWIAGLSDPDIDWALFREIAADKVKALIVMGANPENAEKILGLEVSHFGHAHDMTEAVNQAFSVTQAGDAVLFSPACPAFDMYADYKERGEQFIAEVKRLESTIE